MLQRKGEDLVTQSEWTTNVDAADEQRCLRQTKQRHDMRPIRITNSCAWQCRIHVPAKTVPLRRSNSVSSSFGAQFWQERLLVGKRTHPLENHEQQMTTGLHVDLLQSPWAHTQPIRLLVKLQLSNQSTSIVSSLRGTSLKSSC